MAMKSLSRISRKVSKKKTSSTLPHLEVKPREDRSVELSPNAHMREILKDNVLCWFFKAFLNKQYCSEILSCWLEIEGFRYLESSVEVGNKATYIFQQYIAAEAPRQVNVNESLRDKVQEELGRPKKGMFDEVQVEAFNLMVTDSYTKFIGSAFYASYLENEVVPTVPRSVSAELLDRYLVRCKLPSNFRPSEPEASIAFTDITPTPFMPAQARAPGFMMKTQSAMSLPTLLVSSTGQRSFTTDSIERGGGIGSARGRHRSQEPKKEPKKTESRVGMKLFIVFDFEAVEENEISLKENTVVTVLEESTTGWAKVEAEDKAGWVPSSWLDPLEFLPSEEEDVAPSPPQKPVKSASCAVKLSRVPTDPGPSRSSQASKEIRETILALPTRDDSLNRSATPALPRPNTGGEQNGRGRGMPRGRGRGRGMPPGSPGVRGRGMRRGPPRGQAPPPPRGQAPGTPGRPLPQPGPGRPSRGSLISSAGPPPTTAPPAPPKA